MRNNEKREKVNCHHTVEELLAKGEENERDNRGERELMRFNSLSNLYLFRKEKSKQSKSVPKKRCEKIKAKS